MFPATCGGLGPRKNLGPGQATVNYLIEIYVDAADTKYVLCSIPRYILHTILESVMEEPAYVICSSRMDTLGAPIVGPHWG